MVEDTEIEAMKKDSVLWMTNLQWMAFRAFFIEEFLRSVLFQARRNSIYALFLIPAFFIFAMGPQRDGRSREQSVGLAYRVQTWSSHVCSKVVQAGFVFGQPDHHLSGMSGGLAIWSQAWRRTNRLHTYSRPAFLV